MTPEQGDELKGLYEEYAAATANALAALQWEGMDSQQFFEADLVAGKTNARIREILGIAGLT